MITVSLIIMGVVLPIGIGLISGAGNITVAINGTDTAVSTLADPTVLTLLTVLVPILAIVGIAIGLIPKMR
jgi:hypothetical protein